MKKAIETETKLQIDVEGARAILAAGRVDQYVEQLNIYYDWEWRLAEQSATFRIRLECKGLPTVTLKLPLPSKTDGPRRMRELELVETQLSLWPAGRRFLDVESDLPEALARPLLKHGLQRLARVGWMRNRRSIVVFEGVGVLELDVLRLPTGAVHYEAEIESPDPTTHKRLRDLVETLAPSATLATISKFALFRREASRAHQLPWQE